MVFLKNLFKKKKNYIIQNKVAFITVYKKLAFKLTNLIYNFEQGNRFSGDQTLGYLVQGQRYRVTLHAAHHQGNR